MLPHAVQRHSTRGMAGKLAVRSRRRLLAGGWVPRSRIRSIAALSQMRQVRSVSVKALITPPPQRRVDCSRGRQVLELRETNRAATAKLRLGEADIAK